MPTVCGGESSETSAEPALASPRLFPIPESPTCPESPAFPPAMEDSGQTSNSFDQRCAPSHAPECVNGNYDNLPYAQIRNLCKDRGYYKKDAKAALKTRLEATGAVDRQLISQKENEMDESPSVFGRRGRSIAEQSASGQNQQRVWGETFAR